MGIDNYFLYAGGISGKPASITNSVVYTFSAIGNIFYSGGLAGSANGAVMYDGGGKELLEYYGGNIQGCLARNISLDTELSAGGIAGEGSTNSKDGIISNCYADELSLKAGMYDKDDENRSDIIKEGFCGGIIGADGTQENGHIIRNTVSDINFEVVGNKKKSEFDGSIRLAPDYAFYHKNILTIINNSTVNPNNPKEIFEGTFMFGGSEFGSSENGSLPYPAEISDLFETEEVKEE